MEALVVEPAAVVAALVAMRPNAFAQPPGFHEKDEVENWLHRQVCSGAMPLAEAQRRIAGDWHAVYLEIHAH